jgi:phospholipase/carboxylesterase
MPGMPEARDRVRGFLDALQGRLGVTSDRVVLGGFSQGAMLALDVALHDDRPLAGLVLMSGTIVDEAELRPRIPTRRGLRVYASHGRADTVLPYAHTERLVTLLREGGLDVEMRSFDGDHVVTDEVATDVAAFIRSTSR